MVPADSQQIPRARCYSGIDHRRHKTFGYRTLTHSGGPFQATSPNPVYLSLPPSQVEPGRSTPQHHTHNPYPVSHAHGLAIFRFRSPLLTESQLFSLPAGTEMFHFPAFPPHRLYIHRAVTPHNWCWVPPFGNPRITARLTAPRGISQPPTSFIGSSRQGIHRAPLHTYHTQNPHRTPHRTNETAGAGTRIPCTQMHTKTLNKMLTKIAETKTRTTQEKPACSC